MEVIRIKSCTIYCGNLFVLVNEIPTNIQQELKQGDSPPIIFTCDRRFRWLVGIYVMQFQMKDLKALRWGV